MASRLAVLALFVLAGCAGSPPLYVHTETGRSYGYSETQLSNTQYRVDYRAPRVSIRKPSRIERERMGHARLALAYDLALWRAADVALQLGVPGFAVASRENDVQVEVGLDRPYHHYPFYDPFYYGRPYPYWEPAYRRYDYRYSEIAYIFAEVHLIVDLRDEPGTGAFNAQETLNQMRTKYPNEAPTDST